MSNQGVQCSTCNEWVGHPDLGIACSGRLELAEVKTEDGELNAAQKRFQSVWRGPKIRIVRTRDDVIRHVQDIRRRVAKECTCKPSPM